SAVLSEYAESDVVMRNFAITAVRRAEFGGKQVAEVFGLSESYVSTLHAAALRDGSPALVTQPGPGRPPELDGEALDRARQWRAAGVSDREIGRLLGMAGTTVSRRLGPRGAAAAAAGGGPPAPAAPAAPVPPGDGTGVPGSGGGAGGGMVPGAGGAVAEGRVRSRYAGAMLLHAFGARVGAGDVLGDAAGGLPAAARLLAAVSACIGLGYATTEQFKHVAAAEAGPLAGLAALPDLRTLRPALAGVADRTDPLRLQQLFAQAM